MTSTSFNARKTRFLNRWHARAATKTRTQARGFVSSPEPRTIGSFARGRQLIAGNLLFSGSLIEADAVIVQVATIANGCPTIASSGRHRTITDDRIAMHDTAKV